MSSAPRSTTWPIEPHTLAKHEILQKYLRAWFPIILDKFSKAIYVDGFCGPGEYEGGEVGSPIIALEEALKHSAKKGSVDFYFFDKDKKRIDHLQTIVNSLVLPPKFRVSCQVGEFADLMERLQTSLPDAPMFVFIDPFGWAVPMKVVKRILSRRSAEVLINFMSGYVSRFLNHPNENTTSQLVDLFGSSEVLNLKSSSNRVEDLRLFYQNQLLTTAQYVKFFKMQDAQDKPIYDLFFASKNRLGYIKMKEAFWKVDSTGSFSFSDATNPNQLILLMTDQIFYLEKMLQEKFAGRVVEGTIIKNFVEQETIFLRTHMIQALKRMEQQQSIEVSSEKTNGNRRLKNTFPDEIIVTFS